MQLTQLLRSTGLALGVAALLLMVGCSHHQNPLTTIDPEDAGTFLFKASVAAEKAVKVYQSAKPGDYYLGCMHGKRDAAVCNTLYQAMVAYGKTTDDFTTVRVRDVKDKAVYRHLKRDYAGARFDRLD